MSNVLPKLPDLLTLPGKVYRPGSSYFIFRKPFLINLALEVATPEEKNAHIAPPQTAFYKGLSTRIIDPQKDVYMGIAGLKSFDLLSLAGKANGAHYQHAILYDVNQRQVSAMKEVVELIRTHATREAFMKAFIPVYLEYLEPPKAGGSEYAMRDHRTFQTLSTAEREKYYNVFGANKSKYQPQDRRSMEALKRLTLKRSDSEALTQEHSWLATQKDYDTIRGMVLRNQIEVATMDLRDSARVAKLKKWLKDNDLHIKDMYISSTMSFMDPRFRGDYFNKQTLFPFAQEEGQGEHAAKVRKKGAAAQGADDSSYKSAEAFYKDLQALVDDDGHYLVSIPDKNAEFMQGYHLQSLDKKQMLERSQEALKEKPGAVNKIYDNVFNTVGMVWRLLGFRGGMETRYYRIFAELPVTAGGIPALEKQVADIDRVLEGVNGQLTQRGAQDGKSYASISLNKDVREEGYLWGMETTDEYKFFEKQKKRAQHYHAYSDGIDPERKMNVMLSSQPFRLKVQPGQDPADTLNFIEEKIAEMHKASQVIVTDAGRRVPGQGGGPAALGG